MSNQDWTEITKVICGSCRGEAIGYNLFSQHKTMNAQLPENKLAQIKTALFQGEQIYAIKLYREAIRGAGLTEAKKAIEELEQEMRRTEPEKFVDCDSQQISTPRYRWPWFVLAAFLLAILLAVAWMRHEVQRVREIRDANTPPASR